MPPMRQSTREIEVKLPFASPDEARERLERLGAEPRKPRQFEDNFVLDREDGALKRDDVVLRVRRKGGRSLLTLKTPVGGDHRHKVRNEVETTVGDAAATVELLSQLGFRPSWRYQKYRTVYTLGNLEICLDETPLGCYVELEGPPGEIDRAAAGLGFTPDRYVRLSYGELCERDAERRGVAPGDLLLDPTPDPPE